MLKTTLISLAVIWLGYETHLTLIIVMGVLLLLAPGFQRATGIGWSEVSPRVIVILLILLATSTLLWNSSF